MNDVFAKVKALGEIRKIPQFLFLSEISHESVVTLRQEVLKFKKDNPEVKEIDFILESGGGLADDAYRIIRTLRKNFETVNVVVAFWAKSAATLLSLGATTIIMDEFAEFGPLDVQLAKIKEDGPDYERESALIDEYSLKRIETRASLLFTSTFVQLYQSKNVPINKTELSKQIFDYLARFYEPLLKQINPYKLGDKKRKLEIGEKYADKILTTFNPDLSQRSKYLLEDYLINECPDHGYIIDYDLMSGFLKNVKRSEEIGPEYKEKLTELSMIFLKQEEDIENYIGFIESEESPTDLGNVGEASLETE